MYHFFVEPFQIHEEQEYIEILGGCFICYSGIFCLFYQNQALGFLHYI